MGKLSSRLRLLLVDDESLNLRALSRQLGSHEVLEAQSYDQAQQILQEQSVDVVISDNRMPGRSGVELLTLAASLQPETHRVLLSANPPDNLDELIAQGSIHHFLPKPCSPELRRLLDSLSGVEAGPAVLGLEGTILADKYRLTSLLGFGGMGYIYQAEQLGLERMVAVKLLRPDQVEASTELFHNEARAASRINHPNAVAIYDFGVTRDKVPYLVMEHLRGQTLAEILELESLSLARVITIAAQVLSALSEAHACGVIHRDLKSDNVILEPMRDGSDFVKVIDFGLARLVSDSPDKAGVVGTPEYMAPEQIRGETVGPASDLYSVGVLLYEMLVGRTPFFSERIEEVFRGHLEQTPLPPHRIVSDCPSSLSSLVLQALEKSPEKRMASAGAMRDELLKALRAATGERWCPRCSTSASGQHRFCGRCGAELTTRAPTRSLRQRRDTLMLGDAGEEEASRPGTMPGARTRRTRITHDPVWPSQAIHLGREELEHICEFYRQPAERVALALIGPSGVGKAHLVLQAAHQMDSKASTCLVSQDPSGLRRSWYPVLAMLEIVLALEPDPTLDDLTAAVQRHDLSPRDLPGLAELFGLNGPLVSLELAVRRREARAAAVNILRAAGDRHPGAVLCFTDLDRYDEPSIELIRTLCTELEGTGTRLIITSSDPDLVPPTVETLRLTPLLPDETYQLAMTLSDPALSIPPQEELHALTGGIPEAVEQLVGWIGMGHAVDKAPSKLVDLIAARLSSLVPSTRLMLQAIAIHGTLVSRALLEATLDRTTAVSEQALNELVQLGLIVIDGEIISIRSELVASLASACIPADARRTLHKNVLKILDAEESPVSAPIMAYHAEEADELTRAYGHCMTAGADAERRFDDPGSIFWYRRAQYIARRLAALGEPEGNPWFIEASIHLADVLRFSGQLDLARGILDEAQLYDPAVEQHAGIVRCQGRLAAAGCDYASARDLFQKSIGLSMRAGQWEFVCETYIDQAGVMAQIEDHAVIVEELHEGINVVTLGEGFSATRVPDKLWLLGLRLASLYFQTNHLEEAERIASEALVQAERSRSKQACGRLYSLLARIAEVSGEIERARDYRARAIEQMRTLGDRLSTAELLLASVSSASEGEDSRAPIRTREARERAYELAQEIGWEEGMLLSEGEE